MNFKVDFTVLLVLGTTVTFVCSQSYPTGKPSKDNETADTVTFQPSMGEGDVVDIKARSSTRRAAFLAEILGPGGTISGVYYQGARGRIFISSTKIPVYHDTFGRGKPFRMLLTFVDGSIEVRMINKDKKEYTVVNYAISLGTKVITSVRMRGSYSAGFIRKGRWNDYICLPTDCGRRPGITRIAPGKCPANRSSNKARIIGGSPADAGAHPWQVSIWALKPGYTEHSHVCGAVLIGNCMVLSAAHCFPLVGRPDLYKVRVGDYYNRDDKNNAYFAAYENAQDVAVKSIYAHREYWTSPSTRYDIALVRLRSRADGTCVTLGNFVQPVCLPREKSQFAPGDVCVISGWGASKVDQKKTDYPPCLQQADVRIIQNLECKHDGKGYPNLGDGERVLDNMFCVEGTRGSGKNMSDTCQGDSGGPLVCTPSAPANALEPQHSTVWGITSWGDGCGTHYGVYTKIIQFSSWLTDGMLRLCKHDPLQ